MEVVRDPITQQSYTLPITQRKSIICQILAVLDKQKLSDIMIETLLRTLTKTKTTAWPEAFLVYWFQDS